MTSPLRETAPSSGRRQEQPQLPPPRAPLEFADAARRLPARRRNRAGGDGGRDRRPPRPPARGRDRGAPLRRRARSSTRARRFPTETLAACQAADAVILGAVGLPSSRVPRAAGAGPDRPPPRSRRLREPASRHRRPAVDLLIVRELVGGLYYGASGRRPDGTAFDTCEYTPQPDRADRPARVRARRRAAGARSRPSTR